MYNAEAAKQYLRMLKAKINDMETKIDRLKNEIYHVEDLIMDEQDKQWDEIYKSLQAKSMNEVNT